MAALSAAQLPAPVRDAVTEAADAVRVYAACRGPQYTEARQLLEARLRAANKVLAAHNPGPTVRWADIPTLITKEER
ncbi:hypothetical protein [Streptomyces olivaceus]